MRALLLALCASLTSFAQTTNPVPVGIVVKMSDGSLQTASLGTWLTFQNGTLRVIFPLQYVNQTAVYQVESGSFKYNRAGRNIQVWRNGLLQKETVDYTLDTKKLLVVPVPLVVTDGEGNTTNISWNSIDLVQVAYIY